MDFENEELERATIAKYRIKNVEASIIVYRVNAWNRSKVKDVPCNLDLPHGILHKYYKGVVDFDVNRNLEEPAYTLTGYRSDYAYPTENHHAAIFLCRHKKVSINQCKITPTNYPADHIWIEDDSYYGTFVNGTRIPKGEKYSLVDGDMIGLGAPHHSHEGHWGDDKKKRGFVFKVKNLKLCWEVDRTQRNTFDSSPTFLALNNTLILGKILAFLSHAELKTARLVSKFWKGEADPTIFRRSVVTLQNGGWDDPAGFSHASFNLVWKYDIPNLKIEIMGNEHLYCPDSDVNKRGPIPDDPDSWKQIEGHRINSKKIMHLLKEKGGLIQDIHLQLFYDTDKDMAPITTILSTVPNLQTLRITLLEYRQADNENDTQANSSLQVPATLTLPFVTHLCVIGKYRASYNTCKWENSIIVQAAKLCPNVRKLSTKGGTRTERMLRSISLNNLWTTGLNEVVFEGEWMTAGVDQREIFDLIHGLPQKLKKLVLHRIPKFGGPLEIASFENMLQKHSETLEHLVLRFKMGFDEENPIEKELVLELPVFPKLKILEFIIEHQWEPYFKFVFPTSGSGLVTYETDFPGIQQLRLLFHDANYRKCPTSCKPSHEYYGYCSDFNSHPILDIWIPKDAGTVSQTMRCIKIGLEPSKRKKSNEWYCDFVERFRRMFPHVHHPHLMATVDEIVQDYSELAELESSESPSDDEKTS